MVRAARSHDHDVLDAHPEVAQEVRKVVAPFSVSGVAQAAAVASLDARDELAERVDAVVAEPAGGAHSDPGAAIAAAGDAVEAALAGFDGWSRERIQAARADKFLAIGRR